MAAPRALPGLRPAAAGGAASPDPERAAPRFVFERRPFRGWEPGAGELAALGLGPRFACAVDGKRILLSAPYLVEARRAPAFVGYLRQGATDDWLVKTLFLSRTQNVFRLLKAYRFEERRDGRGEPVELPAHNDKGWSESSLMLPWPLQRAAAAILARQAPLRLGGSLHVFYALAPASGAPSRYERCVEREPLRVRGPGDLPDLDAVLARWALRSELYGACTLRAISSRDGGLAWTFCTDAAGRTWIAGIESTGAVTDLGLRQRWVDAPELLTPAVEYVEHAPTAGGAPAGGYAETPADHLAQQPLVLEYKGRFHDGRRPD